MTEELKVKIKVDTSDVKRQMSGVANDVNKSMGGISTASTDAVNASLSELKDTMNDIKNLDIASAFARFDVVKDAISDASASWRNFIDTLDVGAKSIKSVFGDMFKGTEEVPGGKFENFKHYMLTIKEITGETLNAAGASFKAFGNVIKTVLDSAVVKIAAFVGAVMGLVAAVKNALNKAIVIKEQFFEAKSLGLSLAQYQEWTYIFESVGESADDLADAIKTLSSEQAILTEGSEGNKAAFEALGLSVAQVTKMSQEQLFRETVSRLQQVEDQVERTALAYTIFGEDTAARLTNILHLSNEEMRKMSDNFYLLGGGASDAFTKKSKTLASALQSLRTAWTGLTNTLAEVFMPVVTKVVEWLTKAVAIVNIFLKTVFNLDLATTAASKNNAFSAYTEGAEEAIETVNKLTRATMGFDELNIVDTNSSSSTGEGNKEEPKFKEYEIGDTIFSKAQKQLEDFQKKIRDFLTKWKKEIQIIAAALGALGVAGLITSLGKAIGLGDKFLGIMGTIKKFAGTAIVVTLQYSAISEFMDSYIDGEGFKNYILGLVSAAIGTGILYAMWGPAGAVVGLGVTAVASLNTVFENGGITNAESATVALTAFASAVGAVGLAFAKLKGLSFGALVAPILAAIKGLWTEAQIFTKGSWLYIVNSVKTALAALPGLISGAWSNIVIFVKASWAAFVKSAGAALAAAKGAITTALGAIKTAIVTVIKFVIANPIALIIAAIVALVALIATKGDEIQKALNKVSNWLKNIFVKDWRNVFGNTLGTIMNGAVKIVGDILGNIKKVLNGIIDFIRGIFTGNWRRAWDGIKSIFSGMFGGLVAVAKAPINAIITLVNGMLSGIVSGFNAVKSALNKLSINIPDWVPKYGGKKFGFNLSMSTAPKIPMLANGGIVTGDTIARIGENGKKEAVLPLEQNTGWMDALADRIAARNSNPTRVVLKVDERELGYATINAINQNTKQTGGLKLQLI